MLLPCYDGKSIYFFKPGGIIVKIKEVIIVEGRDDTAKIHQVVDADTIETNGSAINKKTLDQIQHAKNKRSVIIFTDRNYTGEIIRHIIIMSVIVYSYVFYTVQ